MWRTNNLCTHANEDLGTLAEYDPLTEVVPRAEKYGDLTEADHKVLNEAGESWNNHRYAVVVQDLATQMDSVIPVQNKNFSGRKRVDESFSNRHKSQKSFILTNH